MTRDETPRFRPSTPQLALIAALASLLLFLLRVSASVSLGDAPEFTTVVRVLGIAHAPGYPTYVLLARCFTFIEPFGSFALRVALFSDLCASAAVGLVVLICRRLGFGAVTSVGVGLIAASGLAWWWNAGFAKPYALTGLLFVGMVLAGLEWRDHPGFVAPIVGGALLGLASGASYQPVLLATPGLLVLILTGQRRPRLPEAAAGLATAGVTTVALLVFELLRARMGPAVNWGSPTTATALARLVRMTDFHFGARSAFAAQTAATAAHRGRQLYVLKPILTIIRWPRAVFGEYGIVTVGLVLAGIVLWIRSDNRRRLLFLPVLVVVQALGLVYVINLRPNRSVAAVAAFGAFWLPATLAALLFAGVALEALGRLGTGNQTARGRRRERRRGEGGVWLGWLAPLVIAVAVTTAVVSHWWVAGHQPSGMADAYGHDVLTTLPHRAILAVNGAELGQPMLYRQQFDHEAADVDVVFVDLLDRLWYRQQVARRLGLPPFPQMSGLKFVQLAEARLSGRPLYVDGGTAAALGNNLGIEMHGLVWLVKPTATQPTVDTADTQRLLTEVYRMPPLASIRSREWPNGPVHTEFVYAMFRYGLALADQGKTADATDALQRALSWSPGEPGIIAALNQLQQGGTSGSSPGAPTPTSNPGVP